VSVRAIGTQFNVRRRATETDVSVVEGVVQIAAAGSASGEVELKDAGQPSLPTSPAATRLAAGEEAQVKSGQVAKRDMPDVAKTLLWRSRRLDFADNSFAEVAGEFNRYNKTQIRVEGAAAEKRVTGIFYADRPQDFLKYVMRDESLQVEPDGRNWVIKAQ
jgi:transmembrane sensor